MENTLTSPALTEAQANADAAWVALGLTIYIAAQQTDVAWLEKEASHA